MNKSIIPDLADIKNNIFYKIWKLVDEKYVLFEEKKIDWNSIFYHYNDLLDNIDSYDELYELIDQMLLDLRDPHTRVVYSPYKKCDGMIPLILTCINNDFYINENLCGSNLTKGMLVISINDIPIKELVSKIYDRYKFHSKSHMNTLFLKEFNDGNFGHYLKIKAKSDTQNEVIENVYFKYFKDFTDNNSFKVDSMKMMLSLCQVREYDNIGYIRIISFRKENVLNELEKAILNLNHKTALIIDIRGNDGGLIECASKAAGFFTNKDIITGYKIQRKLGGVHNEFTEPIELRIIPHGIINEFRKVVILCDEFTMSSAEYIFLNSLKNSSDKISIVGKKTGGLAHGASVFTLFDGTKIQITTSKYLNAHRNIISENGILPDYEINNTRELLSKNIDNQFEYALSLCQNLL